MKENIDCFLSKVSKVIKGGKLFYTQFLKRKEEILDSSKTHSDYNAKKRFFDFFRVGNRFVFINDFGGLKFKGVLIYGSLAKTIKNELVIYTFPELKKEVYHKNDAFALSVDYVDNKLNFSLLKTTGNLI